MALEYKPPEPDVVATWRLIRIVPTKGNVFPSVNDVAFEEQIESGEWQRVEVPLKSPLDDWVCLLESVTNQERGESQKVFDFSALLPLRLRTMKMTNESMEEFETAVKKGVDGVNMVKLWCATKWETSESVPELYLTTTVGEVYRQEDCNELKHLWLNSMYFGRSHFFGVNFGFTTLIGSWFAGCSMKLSAFNYGQLHGVAFIQTSLKEADLSNAILYDTAFLPQTLENCKFEGSAFIEHSYFKPLSRNLLGAPAVPRYSQAASTVKQSDDGYGKDVPVWKLALRCKEVTLNTHLDELRFLLAELERLREYQVTPANWREFVDAWHALEGLYEGFTCARARATIENLFSASLDPKCQRTGPRGALGMGLQLYTTRGDPPQGLLLALKQHVGRKLRTPYYFTTSMELRDEINIIDSVIKAKAQYKVVAQNALLSAMIGVTNYLAAKLAKELE